MEQLIIETEQLIAQAKEYDLLFNQRTTLAKKAVAEMEASLALFKQAKDGYGVTHPTVAYLAGETARLLAKAEELAASCKSLCKTHDELVAKARANVIILNAQKA
jgi:hypothetical protein